MVWDRLFVETYKIFDPKKKDMANCLSLVSAVGLVTGSLNETKHVLQAAQASG